MARTAGFELDREQVIAGALRLLKQHGVDALTMRKLATELGVTPTAIYYYLPTKDALVDAVVESLYARVEAPAEGPWQDRLRGVLHGVRRVLTEFPGALPYVVSRTVSTPSGLRLSNEALGWLLDAGFTEEQVADAAVMLAIFLIGEGQLESFRQGPGVVHTEAPALASIDFSQLGNIMRVAPHMARPVGQVDFDRAVDLLISDLERLLLATS